MELFREQAKRHVASVTPLAVSMRPRTLDEFRGQEHFIGEGKLLRRMIQADRLTSAVFYGPPGSGKTTLAHIIAAITDARFVAINAAAVGVKEVRSILAQARADLESTGQCTILFVDELHRFNRAQQDVLLDEVESGIVTLIGATTENPFFTVNAPLISRSQIFEFKPLNTDAIKYLLDRALCDRDRGLGRYRVTLDDDAADFLANTCDGDARRALTALEVAVRSQLSNHEDNQAPLHVTATDAADSIQRKALNYDAFGDAHYDTASALIKSMRGSDPDAAVYWLARMLESGEDPRFVARRIVIAAAEDVGNADPQALVIAQAAADATAFVGMPECQLPLSQAAIYVACAPKSNACAQAIWQATTDVRNGRTRPVPKHLKNVSLSGSNADTGTAYVNPHDQAEGVVADQYMGVDKQYYVPTDRGAEAELASRLVQIRAVHAGSACNRAEPEKGSSG